MPDPRGRGRPCLYTPELHEEIIERLSSGETLQDICRSDGMPEVRTINRWTDPEAGAEDVPASFSSDFARARLLGHDAIAAQCLTIANTPQLGEEITIKPDGSEEVKRGDMLGHRKLQIDTRLKLLAKWDPKRYGESSKVELSGALSLEQLVSQSLPKDEPSV